MLSAVGNPVTIRPVGSTIPQIPIYICAGVPSCAPSVQHELLRAVREQIPHAYARAGRELELTIAKTQEILDRKIDIVSAARALKLAGMIAYEPNAGDVFAQTGKNVFHCLNKTFPIFIKVASRNLSERLRVRLGLVLLKQSSFAFAGSTSKFYVKRHDGGIAVSIRNGIFSERSVTMGAASQYYKNILESMLTEFAHAKCRVIEVRKDYFYPNQCVFNIVWET